MKSILWSKMVEMAYDGKTLEKMIKKYRAGIGERALLKEFVPWEIEEEEARRFSEKLTREGIELITIYQEIYPQRLREIALPPIALYFKGNRGVLRAPMIAVVGSRQSPESALQESRSLGENISRRGLIGVSGLALGVDAAFHEGCASSLGVIGCGIDVVYPRANYALYKKVIAFGGLVSEFPLGTKPLPFHFPRRNRIISGIAEALIVIHAREKSGALITLDYALDQGKDIFLPEELIAEGLAPGYPLEQLDKYLDTFRIL